MNYSIIVFPGSNCDKDCYDAVTINKNNSCSYVWHQENKLPQSDCIILPGGFSYGDYLRAGAIAKTSPIMKKVIEFANDGGIVIGICNGFQILTEAKLLPGTLMKNSNLKFICKNVYLKVENNNTIFTNAYNEHEITDMPIAHSEGNYYIDDKTYNTVKENNQIIFKYCDKDGQEKNSANPNGSKYNIAGICNKKKNILGLMPHPERSIDQLLGSNSGLLLFKSIENYIANTLVN